jgi:uncharacterized membrane protein
LLPSPDQERLDVMSAALANLVREQNRLNRRLERIETALKLGELESPPPAPPPPLPAFPTTEAASPEIATLPDTGPAPVPPPHDHAPGLEARVGLTIVNRVGVITLVLGIGFLFKWAADNEWIGPAGRVMLGVIASFAALGGADVLWRRGQRVFAQGITATGISILYLAIYAAFGFYQLIPQTFAFLLMAVTSAMAGTLALRYNARAIAALGLVGGFLTPVVLSTGENRPWFLFGYVLLLDLGALAVARVRKWRLLEVLSFVGTMTLYGVWLGFSPRADHFVATFYLLVFYALFGLTTTVQPVFLLLQLGLSVALADIWEHNEGAYLPLNLLLAVAALAVADWKRWRYVPSVALASYGLSYVAWASALRDPIPTAPIFLGLTCAFLAFFGWLPWWTLVRQRELRAQDLVVLALNGGAYFAACYKLLNPSYHAWMGLFAVALAAAHLGVGAWLWRTRGARGLSQTPVLLAVGISLTFLTLAAPIQFTAYRITLSWALEAAGLTWIAARVKNAYLTYAGALIFILVFIRLLVIDALIYSAPTGHSAILNERFVTFALSAICLWLSAYWLRPDPLAIFQYFAGHVVLLWTLTQEVLDWAGRGSHPNDLLSVETVSISILYAIYAMVLIGIGVLGRFALNRIAGLGLMGFVVVKLYIFDIWQLSRLYRTLAFVALGVLLLSTSFLYSHFRALVESWWRDDEAPS